MVADNARLRFVRRMGKKMGRLTKAERDEIRTLFRQLADIQAGQIIERLEANPNAVVQIDVPAAAMIENDIRDLAGLGGPNG